MNRKLIIKEVDSTEQEIGRLVAGFSSDPEKIARIDIDLALEKIRKLYDMVLKLEGSESEVIMDRVEKEEVIVEEPALPQVEKEIEEPEDSLVVKEEMDVKEEISAEKENAEKPGETETSVLFETETKPEKPESIERVNQVSTGVTMDLFGETVADKIAPEADKTVADSISEKIIEESVADVINKTGISDLKAAIGINEKFFFINELFDGNMKDYNDTIDTLNTFADKNEAVDYFTGLKSKNQWKDDNEAVVQLMELIGRRYFD
jgi:hypothetical protein